MFETGEEKRRKKAAPRDCCCLFNAQFLLHSAPSDFKTEKTSPRKRNPGTRRHLTQYTEALPETQNTHFRSELKEQDKEWRNGIFDQSKDSQARRYAFASSLLCRGQNFSA
jgi:hypothetical protein